MKPRHIDLMKWYEGSKVRAVRVWLPQEGQDYLAVECWEHEVVEEGKRKKTSKGRSHSLHIPLDMLSAVMEVLEIVKKEVGCG